ncbi:P-loop containing nucleoside triphosphate hydrolase protein [Pelagophyceae sp. CCMP2097]|nr:P-loop containing nucleoside triphosphate hydrolase protein [Pelagophyceae sp. CCMP2097]
MTGIDSSLKAAPLGLAAAKPERLDEAARDEADEAMADARRGEQRVSRDDPDGAAGDAADAAPLHKKKMNLLEPVDHARAYEAVPLCLMRGGVAAWNAGGASDASDDDGDDFAAGASGGVRRAKSFADMFQAAPDAAWLLKAVARQGLEAPTAVQALAVPAALCGRDVLALAQTGSGKTLAYGWPLLAHVSAQRPSEAHEGPLALVVCPTRELCEQIYRELSRYAKQCPTAGVRAGAALAVVAIFSGAGKYEMGRALAGRGADVAVATPGRLMELVRDGKADLQSRCTFLVVDEADRMLDLGFADQLRCVAQHCRPSRQTMLTSATLPDKLDGLARGALRDPIRVVVGRAGASAANDSVAQEVHVFVTAKHKWLWLAQRLPALLAGGGRVIVFVSRKVAVDELGESLRRHFQAAAVHLLHGDKDAADRAAALAAFRKRGGVLVATDVAARGLDVRDVGAVVNFDAPKTIEAYIHRVGRTGRVASGDGTVADGHACTLLARDSKDDAVFAKKLAASLRQSKRNAPSTDLLAFAGLASDRRGAPAAGPAGFVAEASRRGLGAEIPPPSAVAGQPQAGFCGPGFDFGGHSQAGPGFGAPADHSQAGPASFGGFGLVAAPQSASAPPPPAARGGPPASQLAAREADASPAGGGPADAHPRKKSRWDT